MWVMVCDNVTECTVINIIIHLIIYVLFVFVFINCRLNSESILGISPELWTVLVVTNVNYGENYRLEICPTLCPTINKSTRCFALQENIRIIQSI